MSTIVTRAGKGSSLTWAEGDANFTNLNTDKYESGDSPVFAVIDVTSDGTAAAPSVQIGGEENGLFSPAANELAMALGGTKNVHYGLTTYSNVVGQGTTPTAWSNTLAPVTAYEVGSIGSLMASASSFYIMQNVKQDSAYNLVYRNTGQTAGYMVFSGSQLNFYLAASGTAGDTISFSNPIRFDTTDVELLCGQLKFPAVQVASSDVNTLDDYEEGTWTPTDTSGAGLTLSGTLYYTKIGRLVNVTGTIQYPASADVTSAQFSLPIAAAATASYVGGCVCPFVSTGVHTGWMIASGEAVARAYDPATAASRTNANLSTAILYAINMTYPTA